MFKGTSFLKYLSRLFGQIFDKNKAYCKKVLYKPRPQKKAFKQKKFPDTVVLARPEKIVISDNYRFKLN